MKAGDLRNRITIQLQSNVQDANGEMVNTWSDVALVWASIKHVSGLSAIRSGMDVSSVKASIRIRHRTGINAGMRILNGDSVYTIEAILPDDRREYLDAVCAVKNAES